MDLDKVKKYLQGKEGHLMEVTINNFKDEVVGQVLPSDEVHLRLRVGGVVREIPCSAICFCKERPECGPVLGPERSPDEL